MSEIDYAKMAQDLALARSMLKQCVLQVEREMAATKIKGLPAIRRLAENAANKQAVLHDAIGGHPEEFVKPKTKILHGIRFGMVKKRGEIIWEDDDKVITYIKKNLPDQVEMLIRTKETPVKGALAELPGADLKKMGVTVEKDRDEVFIKATDSEIDKIVEAILGKEKDQLDDQQ